jgi:PKD repeat protein
LLNTVNNKNGKVLNPVYFTSGKIGQYKVCKIINQETLISSFLRAVFPHRNLFRMTSLFIRLHLMPLCLILGIFTAGNSQSIFTADAFDCTSEKINLGKNGSFDLAFKQYDIITLDATALSNHLQSRGRTAKNINFKLGEGKNFGLVVRPHEMRTPDFQLIVADDNGVKVYPRGENTTYTARFEDATKDCSRLTIDDDFIQGFIRDGNDYVYIEPARFHLKSAPRNTFVVYRQSNVQAPSKNFCDFDQAEWERAQRDLHLTPQPESPCSAGKQVELAVAADFESFTNKGSVEDVKNYVFAIDNAMELKQYTGVFTIGGSVTDISFTIKVFYVATTAAANPYSPLTTTNAGSTRLANFGTWGAASFGTTYDLSQVWTGIDIQSGGSFDVVGIGSFPGVCFSNVAFRRQINEDGLNASAAVTEQIAAHETGHNFNAPHDDGSAPCTTVEAGGVKYLMNPSVDGDPIRTWSPCTKGQVETYIGGISCLGNCTTLAAPVADFIALPKVGCANAPVIFTDLSTNEPTSRAWTFGSGTPATSSATSPSITWSAAGNYNASLAVTNSLGTSPTNTKTAYVKVLASASNPCVPTGTNLGTKGINSVTLSNLSKTSGSSSVDGNNYMDFACSNVAYLNPSTTYNISINVTGLALRVWINYNDNSSFTDAGELVYTTDGLSGGNFCWTGDMAGTFTTPAVGSLTQNKLLRMRVWANCVITNNPCGSHTSSGGQIEDYSVYFGTALPVELVDFTGNWQKTHSALNWATAQETRSNGFEVQRSFDGKTFEKLGFVKSLGQSAKKQAYWFNDYDLAKNPQYAYYRLKQIDDNGDYSYSKTIIVTPDNVEKDWKIYPNPSKNTEVSVTFEGSKDEKIQIEWLDMMGRVRQTSVQEVVKGQNVFNTDISTLESGVYFVRAYSTTNLDKSVKTIRFVKL